MSEALCGGALNSDAEILTQGKDCTVYQVKSDGGLLAIKEYHIFPGIWLVYKDAHTRQYQYPPYYPAGLLEITHCCEGRLEYSAADRFFYLSKGDMSIHKTTKMAAVYCPTQHYYGVSVIVDPTLAPSCLSSFLTDVNVSPLLLLKKFCKENQYFIMRSTAQLEHIFSELYTVPSECKKGYFKVKVLELLLFLNSFDPECSQTEQQAYSKAQVELAARVSQFLGTHLSVRLTIEQLSEEFYVSSAQLKKCIYSVYGESVYAYIKAYKMRSAAQCLRETGQTISEIACDFGYSNSSKFSKAFKDVIGVTPTEYRRGT